MYTHSFHHVHDLQIFERSRKVMEQHAIIMLILAIVIMLGGAYALSIRSGSVRMFHFSEVSEVGIRLSRFADPQYAHEVAAREQTMNAALDSLQRNLQADRAYIAIYGVIEEFSVEYQVISVLEATKTDIAPSLQSLQGIGRLNWLQIEDNAYRVNWLSSENAARIYGMELYDEQGTPIGYLGIENMQAHGFAEQNIQRLRETAHSIEAVMLQPSGHVNTLKEL